MNAKILISLSVRHVTLGVFAQGRLMEVRSFSNDEPARVALGELLTVRPRTPVYLMADVADEEYRAETMPHVRGRARAEMVTRKQAQYFRAAPYRAAWLQGRVEGRGKRRDDQYLFMALNSGDLLRPYLELIEYHRAPLAGIFLLPVVSQVLVERLKPTVPGVLLVSMQGGGLRQSFFHDGRLRMSRLTALDGLDANALAQLLPDEIEKSRLFLYNSRLCARDEMLQVWVLDPNGELHAACTSIPKESYFACQALGREALLKVFGMMAETDLPRGMDAVMLCLLGRYAPDCSLASIRQMRAFSHLRWRRGLQAAAAGLGMAAIVWSGYNLYAYSDYQHQSEQARQQTAELRLRYEEAARSFPEAPTSAENMRKAVETVGALRARARTPDVALRAMGDVLLAYPGISLNRIAWRYGGERASTAVEEAELSAEIHPFSGDYRSALRLIGEFAERLRKQPGVSLVQVLSMPVNLDSRTSLSGNTLDAPDAGVAGAQFKLLVRMGRTE